MIKYVKEYQFYIILFAFLMIPIAAIDTSTRAPKDYGVADRVIVAVTSPIQSGISWTLDQAATTIQNYFYLWSTRQENLALHEESRRLLNEIARLKEMEQENIRLRRLLDFQERFALKSIVARVIAKDVSSDFRSIRINRGETSGIKKNMAVLTHEGVVGRILRTTAKTADVVTVLDLLSAVDAINSRSRARGIVEGFTDDSCQLKYTLRTDDVQPGDTLITSGLGGLFPKSVPVGVVSKVLRKPFGISQEVEVRPSVDFNKLEEVMIVTSFEDKTDSDSK